MDKTCGDVCRFMQKIMWLIILNTSEKLSFVRLNHTYVVRLVTVCLSIVIPTDTLADTQNHFHHILRHAQIKSVTLTLGITGGTIWLHRLLPLFAAYAHCVCFASCVRCIHAGISAQINHHCWTLPAVVSRLRECNAECLQHPQLHSITLLYKI